MACDSLATRHNACLITITIGRQRDLVLLRSDHFSLAIITATRSVDKNKQEAVQEPYSVIPVVASTLLNAWQSLSSYVLVVTARPSITS